MQTALIFKVLFTHKRATPNGTSALTRLSRACCSASTRWRQARSTPTSTSSSRASVGVEAAINGELVRVGSFAGMCFGCGLVSRSASAGYRVLELPIGDDVSACTMQQAVDAFFQAEEIDDLNCAFW